jgi:hypothetical protein
MGYKKKRDYGRGGGKGKERVTPRSGIRLPSTFILDNKRDFSND